MDKVQRNRGETLKATMISKYQEKFLGTTKEEAYDLWKADMRARASKGGSKKGVLKGFAHPNANPAAAVEIGRENSRRRKANA